MHRAIDAAQLPKGVEQVLTLAALDHTFRQRVAQDPVTAAQEKGIQLDEIEAKLLQSTKPDRLAQMSEKLVIPKKPGRRQFIKAVSASIVAMVTGKAVMLCSGCTGADTWVDDKDPLQKWMDLGGHTCYVYLPKTVVAYPQSAAPVLVTLHGQGETCLSNVQRWYNTADMYGFSLISVNWTEEAITPEDKDKLIADLPQILDNFNNQYAIDRSNLYLSSRGESTPMIWEAGFLRDNQLWSGVVFLGGVPGGDWENNSAQLIEGIKTDPPALYYVIGKEDPEYSQAVAFCEAADQAGVDLHKDEVEGSTSRAVLSFSEIWTWIERHGR